MHNGINLNGELVSKDAAFWLLEKMLMIRLVEERIVEIYPTDVMVTPVHLHIGQEAVPTGVCAHLTPYDTIFFGHRTHGPALAKGMDLKVFFAELYGRTTGCSSGYGGSMHLIDVSNGMLGSSSVVGGSISLGVGSALASKLMNADYISVSYFGDGATNSGVYWESINFAAIKELPVLFVCEDNSLSNVMPKAEHMYLSSQLPVVGNFMKSFKADGTDALSVYQAALKAIEYIRRERKPAFLECKTKRWMKHQGIEKDDLAINPVNPEHDDPIKKLQDEMLQSGLITSGEVLKLEKRIASEIDVAIEFAEESPFPNKIDLVREV